MFVCLFDIDGTLLRSGGAGKAAMEAALSTAFGVPNSADGIPFSGRTDRSIGRDLFHLHGVETTPENWQRFLAAYLQHLPSCLDRHQGEILPGIAALLQRLAQRKDVTVGLLTGNIRAGARLKLEHFGLYEHFAFGGYGDNHWERDDVAREALAMARLATRRFPPSRAHLGYRRYAPGHSVCPGHRRASTRRGHRLAFVGRTCP